MKCALTSGGGCNTRCVLIPGPAGPQGIPGPQGPAGSVTTAYGSFICDTPGEYPQFSSLPLMAGAEVEPVGLALSPPSGILILTPGVYQIGYGVVSRNLPISVTLSRNGQTLPSFQVSLDNGSTSDKWVGCTGFLPLQQGDVLSLANQSDTPLFVPRLTGILAYVTLLRASDILQITP